MCYALYLASERALPIVEWNENDYVFFTEELAKHDEGVLSQFTKPNVYYLGSYEGCSCGFFYNRAESFSEKTKDSVHCWCAFISQALETTAELEIFACWAGEEENKPKKRVLLTPQQLCDKEKFPLDKDYFAIIRKHRPNYPTSR
jgi:hypothetical protein